MSSANGRSSALMSARTYSDTDSPDFRRPDRPVRNLLSLHATCSPVLRLARRYSEQHVIAVQCGVGYQLKVARLDRIEDGGTVVCVRRSCEYDRQITVLLTRDCLYVVASSSTGPYSPTRYGYDTTHERKSTPHETR